MSMAGKNTYHESRHAVPKGWQGTSLRNRIALFYTAATALLIGLVFTLIYLIVSNAVFRHIDDDLTRVSSVMIEKMERRHYDDKEGHALTEKNDEEHRLPEVNPEFIQFFDHESQIVRKSGNLQGNTLTRHEEQLCPVFFNSSLAGSPVRQAQMPVYRSDGSLAGYLTVAVPLKDALRVLKDLRTVLLVTFPGIAFFLFLLARGIAGRSIAPIGAVMATAEAITQENLDERISLPQHRDELYRLSSTINELLDRLQRAFQREKQFTADASHELKTPLASVKGTLEVLIRKPRDVAHYESRIRVAIGELNRMAALIDQLLMLARHDNERLQPNIREIDLVSHVETVMARMQPSAIERQITLTLQPSGAVKAAADPAMFDVMLMNIMSNAVKYSHEGSAVDVGLKRVNGSVACTVADRGIGIPAEKLPHVFDRFYRVDESRSSKISGSGLGLSIVRKLAELQNIKIDVKSRENVGTTVVMLVPTEARS